MHPSFATPEGRIALYNTWHQYQIAQGSIDPDRTYEPKERQGFFAEWLRLLICEGIVDPRKPLPSYETLMELPFNLTKRRVGNVIRQLRAERVLPRRKRRQGATGPRWTRRDLEVLKYIGEMHAMRFDQLRRLLTRLTPTTPRRDLLSLSRTRRIVRRWTRANLVRIQYVYHEQPGWISLTGQGLRLVNLSFSSKPLSDRSYEHLYWINEVRMHLEQCEPQMTWICERAIQAQQPWRLKGQSITHIPDGRILLPRASGKPLEVDIEVQISKPSPHEVDVALGGDIFSKGTSAPLRYYVNQQSRTIVTNTYTQKCKEVPLARSSVEIIDLDSLGDRGLVEESSSAQKRP